MKKKNNTKPWLDKNGKLKSDSELKTICLSWDQKTWNDYLATIEHDQSEVVLDKAIDNEKIIDCDQNVFIETTSPNNRPYSKRFILTVLQELPNDQRKILEKIYFDGLSLSEIARASGTNKMAIMRARNIALNNLMQKFFDSAFSSNRLNKLWEVMEKTVIDHFEKIAL